MTTTTTKSKIVSQIQTQNLITYTLSQTAIEKNFQLIIDALSLNEDEINGIKLSTQKSNNKVIQVEKSLIANAQKEKENGIQTQITKQKIIAMTQRMNQMQKSLRTLESEYAKDKQATKIKFQKMALNPQVEKDEKTQKHNNKKLDDLMRIVNAHEESLRQIGERVTHFEVVEGKNKDTVGKDIQILRKQINTIGQQTNLDSIHDAIDGLKKLIGEFSVVNLYEELKIVKQKVESNREESEQKINKMNQQIETLKMSLEDQKRLRVKNSQEVWKMNEQLFKLQSDKLASQMNNPKSLVDMEKDLTQIKIKLSILFRDIPEVNPMRRTGRLQFSQTRINEQDINSISPHKNTNNTGINSSDLRGEMLDKMKQTKSQILKIIRKADLYSNPNNEFDPNKLILLEDEIRKLEHLLAMKSDTESVKKLFAYIQNKINFIFNMVNSATQEDALVAKRQWLCLSCDKQLDNYKGKVGNFLVTQIAKGKKIEADVFGGGMSMRSRSKKQLPSLANNKLKK